MLTWWKAALLHSRQDCLHPHLRTWVLRSLYGLPKSPDSLKSFKSLKSVSLDFTSGISADAELQSWSIRPVEAEGAGKIFTETFRFFVHVEMHFPKKGNKKIPAARYFLLVSFFLPLTVEFYTRNLC